MEGLKISVGGAFDLQPLRVLFLFSVVFLIVDPFIKQYKKKIAESEYRVQPRYETYVIAFTVLSCISYTIYSRSDPAKLFVAITTVGAFVVIYFAVKRGADEGMKQAVKLSLVSVAVISTLVAIYQLVGDQSFFRVYPDYSRSAFGGLLRSTGVFRDDYIHSYVVFCALVWISFTDFTGIKKRILSTLFLIGIFIAFMRMGYVVTAFFVAHAIIYASNVNLKLKVLVITLSAIIGVFAIFLILGSGVMESSVAQERMMDEGTMELRFELYQKAIEVSFSDIHGIIFGYGGTESPVYYNAMYEVTGNQAWALGERGGWHNLFLEVLFFNGLPAVIFLLIFLIAFPKYYLHLKNITGNAEYYIPFYLGIGYIIANLTLGLGLETNFGIIIAISAAIMLKNRENQIKLENSYANKNYA
ncbi:O-antigen ligase family protein [Catalinimonas alkaloidigena]|uniref:O-antigen ligase family protein n=1 Tax=Catalinimonas alkaloidigena TaxID=1075417 RepID=UPI002405179F|nr:O-antigen ligase family protein [Catalinimonas alkaloidigena]